MAQGTFIEGEQKLRPGVYFLLKARAQNRVDRGARGRVALPVRADWGPEGTIESITAQEQIELLFGRSRAGTTVRLLSLAWQARPREILAYRLVGAAGAAATVTLADTAAANVVRLTALYKGARPNAGVGDWQAVIAANIQDGAKKDLKLMEGSVLLATWTFDGTPNGLVAAVTANAQGYLTAVKLADGNGTVANTAGAAFAGGDSGLVVTNQAYLDWLGALEAYKEVDVLSLDGVSDAALQDSLVAWLKRVRTEGLWLSAALGHVSDADPAAGATRAQAINYRAVTYVISGGYLAGEATVYTPAEAAVWVASRMAATPLAESFTGARTPFAKIGKRLTNLQIVNALLKGALTFEESSGAVTVERALNTLNAPSADEAIEWQSIKVSTIIDAVAADLGATGDSRFKGKVANTSLGRSAIVGAVLDYFSTLATDGIIQPEYEAGEDPANPSAGNSAHLVYGFTPVDAVEKIFFRGTIAS